MASFLIFTGVPYGRMLMETLLKAGAKVCVGVTDSRNSGSFPEGVQVLSEPCEAEKLATLLQTLRFDCVIDAGNTRDGLTSEDRRAACAFADTRFLRLANVSGGASSENSVYVDSTEKAVEVLKATIGTALLTIGMREMEAFTALPDFQKRLYMRVHPTVEEIGRCTELGFLPDHIIGMYGPFTRETNGAMLRQTGASIIVIRASEVSNVTDKLLAAQDVGATAVVIGRLKEEKGLSYEELLDILDRDYEIREQLPTLEEHTFFPVFLDLASKKIKVFGGGSAAANRAETILRFCEHVFVVSPQFDAAFDHLDVIRVERPYLRGDCVGCDYVFAATDNREINHAVYEEARSGGIPINVADAPEECSFFFPEIVQRGNLVAGVCTVNHDLRLKKTAARLFQKQLDDGELG